jgi:hypothetical protein
MEVVIMKTIRLLVFALVCAVGVQGVAQGMAPAPQVVPGQEKKELSSFEYLKAGTIKMAHEGINFIEAALFVGGLVSVGSQYQIVQRDGWKALFVGQDSWPVFIKFLCTFAWNKKPKWCVAAMTTGLAYGAYKLYAYRAGKKPEDLRNRGQRVVHQEVYPQQGPVIRQIRNR